MDPDGGLNGGQLLALTQIEGAKWRSACRLGGSDGEVDRRSVRLSSWAPTHWSNDSNPLILVLRSILPFVLPYSFCYGILLAMQF